MSSTSSTNNIRVVAAIDFGTTYSGFACAHKNSPKEIYVQDFEGSFKTPTVLKYDNDFYKVISWGIPALAERTNRRKNNADDSKPVELFKLHLGNIKENPYLPGGLDYKKAITDYLHEIGEMMKAYLKKTYKSLDFFDQVLVILTVPAEFNNDAILIMRDCAFKAELTNARNSRNLKFITEPEAAAVHCMNFLSGNGIKTEDSFMIVDCGGGTVDLTTRQILLGNTLSEITERVGGYCVSSFIDKRFIGFLEGQFGKSAIDILKKNHYRQLQYLVQEFCNRIKLPFTGEPFQDDDEVELDIEELCPVLKQYCRNFEFFNKMEESEWIIVLTHKDVKDMFDPIIAEIIRLIRGQLNSISNCSAIILVGGFSESKYLQKRIKQEFQHKLKNISVPRNPMAAVVKGAVEYGMNEHVITSRILKWTYGTDIAREWEPTNDPPSKKLSNGMVKAFYTLAKRGTYLTKATTTFRPYTLFQKKVSFNIYTTPDNEADAKYIGDNDVKLLNEWEIDIPILKDFDDQTILLTLNFSNVEILATAENLKTKDRYQITFNYEV
ncbi:actin-like ATPase domain-containing protein [Rhizophagus irregularis]|uniref:Actin-like ATPase domain-containing protein n=1 Tax=Rhizophagus irregularis TaxID=588596 RepID=A0A2N0Q4C7_9GLOM|nr:actin-like ATPase domain-containing protein [Rhizophagus irregularis]